MGIVRRPLRPDELESQEAGGYVVCLDCGKKFSYDPRTMSIGEAIEDPAPR